MSSIGWRRKWITDGERDALMESCLNLDPGRTGRISVDDIGTVLDSIGEKVRAATQKSKPRENTVWLFPLIPAMKMSIISPELIYMR